METLYDSKMVTQAALQMMFGIYPFLDKGNNVFYTEYIVGHHIKR